MDEESKIFSRLKHDFKNAEDAKVEVDNQIEEWNLLYYGDNYGRNEFKHRHNRNKSKMKMMEIAKQIEFQKPNITEPFLSSIKPINVTTQMSEDREHQIEKWLNYEFVANFDRATFMDEVADTMLREGTVWAQSSWETEYQTISKEHNNISTMEILDNNINAEKVEELSNGNFNIIEKKEILKKNKPTVEVLRNEHALPDPLARTVQEMNFFCRIRYWSYEEMKQNALIDKTKLSELLEKIDEDERNDDSTNENHRMGLRINYEQKYSSNNRKLKKIKVIEYWGNSEIVEGGEIVPMVAFWAVTEDILLGIDENPMPNKEIPFDRLVYSSKAFSLWGNPPAFFLGDNQKLKTGMVRGVIDNMALANNGQKFITKNTMDYVNYKRMINGEKYIYVNRQDGIKDGSYNNVPSSIFNMIEMINSESQGLTGTNPNQAGVSSSKLSKDGEMGQLTIAEKKNISLVRNMSSFLSNIMYKWATMGEVFLEDEQILSLFEESELVNINAFEKSRHSKIIVSVATEETKNIKMNAMNMLMQQSKTLENNLPQGILNSMVAEMFDMFDMHEKATTIRNYVPEPSAIEQQNMELDLTKKQLENSKLMVETQTLQKEVEAKYINAQARMLEATSGDRYKDAQIEEKKAKARNHEIDGALKPIIEQNKMKKESEING